MMNCSKLLSYGEKNEGGLTNRAVSSPTAVTPKRLSPQETHTHTSSRRFHRGPAHTGVHAAGTREMAHESGGWMKYIQVMQCWERWRFLADREAPHTQLKNKKQFPLKDPKRYNEIYNLCHPSSQSVILRWNSAARESLPDLTFCSPSQGLQPHSDSETPALSKNHTKCTCVWAEVYGYTD